VIEDTHTRMVGAALPPPPKSDEDGDGDGDGGADREQEIVKQVAVDRAPSWPAQAGHPRLAFVQAANR